MDIADQLAEVLYEECRRLIKLDPPPDSAAGKRLVSFLKTLKHYDKHKALRVETESRIWIRRADESLFAAVVQE